MIPDNQLARGIQSKSNRGLWVETPQVAGGGGWGGDGVVSELVEVPNSLRMLSTKSTISQKLKKKSKIKISVSEHGASFGTKKIFFFSRFYEFLTIISKKQKIAEIWKLIFHSFQNIAQHFGPTDKSTHFQGGGSAHR